MSAHVSQSKLPQILWWIACLAVIVAIAGGLMLTGGPARQRAERMDERRERDLAEIQHAIDNYYQAHRKLPQSLDNLTPILLDEFNRDPATGQPYGYRVAGPDTIELCANFETDTRHETRRGRFRHRYVRPDGDTIDYHLSGRQCFTLRRVASDEPTGRHRFQWVK